jgi:uncharacterized protein (DUF2062 family)
MWHLTKRAVERWMESLLHIHDTPKRTAAAFGLGVAIGFSPFLGLHSVIGLCLAFVFDLNRVAVLAGLWLNLPWFMAPYYTAATALGAWITGSRMPPDFLSRLEHTWDMPTWGGRMHAAGHLLRPLLVPYTLGSMLAALSLGLLAYRSTLAFIEARKRHRTTPEPGGRP